MTIMGKILVVLVLLLALFRGWLDVKYSVVKSNWKVAYDDADRELKAARANTAAALDENQRLKTRHDTLANDLAKLRKEFADFKLTSDKKLRDQQDLTKKQEDEATKSKAVTVALTAEAERLRKEVALHQQAVEERDKTILAQEDRLDKLLKRTVGAETNVVNLKAKNTNLLDQLENVSKKLARLEANGGTTTVARRGSEKNPPSAFVKGVVTNVLRDSGLIEISIGSDEGVNADNTLEVYRLRPKPEYLGTLRILEAYHHKAVGRLLRPDSGVRRGPVQKGDEVASKIVDR